MTRYFAAINPATDEIACTRSSKTRNYQAACAIRWDDNDTLGVASFHGDDALAAKAGGPYINRGAVETQVWEVREITKAEFNAHRDEVKARRSGRPATQAKAYGASTQAQAQTDLPTRDEAEAIKTYKLTKPMVRDLVGAIGTHVECHGGMTSKGLRARGILAEGEGRQGMLTDEGIQVVQVLRGL